MQTLILAAGRGTRLGNKTQDLPKPLLSLSGKPIIDFILKGLLSFQENEVIVIGGFQFPKLSDHIRKHHPKVGLVSNPDFQKGNLLTLLCAQDWVNKDFCLTNADHVFSRGILGQVFQDHTSITVVCDFNRTLGDDDMKILRRSNGTLEKMSKTLSQFDGGYIGMTVVPKEKSSLYWNAVDRVFKKYGDSIHVEEVLNELSAGGGKIEILDVSGHPWFEVDTMEDLKRAERMIQEMEV